MSNPGAARNYSGLVTAFAFLGFCIAFKESGVERVSYGGPGSLPAKNRASFTGMVAQPRRGAVRIDVPLAGFLQGHKHKVEGGFEEDRLEEEVRVVRSAIEIGMFVREGLLKDFVGFIRPVLDE